MPTRIKISQLRKVVSRLINRVKDPINSKMLEAEQSAARAANMDRSDRGDRGERPERNRAKRQHF